MRVLIYKRTHSGDPDESGQFGVHDCMGQVRRWNFDAVIGGGGVGAEARSWKIDERVNWIGIGPHKKIVAGRRGPLVTFDHFILFGKNAPRLEQVAPALAQRIYSRNVRVLMNGLSPTEEREVQGILRRARNAPPSPRRVASADTTGKTCSPKNFARRSKALKGC